MVILVKIKKLKHPKNAKTKNKQKHTFLNLLKNVWSAG